MKKIQLQKLDKLYRQKSWKWEELNELERLYKNFYESFRAFIKEKDCEDE